jgi:hypothetical protein
MRFAIRHKLELLRTPSNAFEPALSYTLSSLGRCSIIFIAQQLIVIRHDCVHQPAIPQLRDSSR